jgi:hypothetical protein
VVPIRATPSPHGPRPRPLAGSATDVCDRPVTPSLPDGKRALGGSAGWLVTPEEVRPGFMAPGCTDGALRPPTKMARLPPAIRSGAVRARTLDPGSPSHRESGFERGTPPATRGGAPPCHGWASPTQFEAPDGSVSIGGWRGQGPRGGSRSRGASFIEAGSSSGSRWVTRFEFGMARMTSASICSAS